MFNICKFPKIYISNNFTSIKQINKKYKTNFKIDNLKEDNKNKVFDDNNIEINNRRTKLILDIFNKKYDSNLLIQNKYDLDIGFTNYVLAVYFQVNKKYQLMKYYYLISIENNFTESMYNLAVYYKNIETDYFLMKKYYLLAIENLCANSMYDIAEYYFNHENNIELAINYYLLSLINGLEKAFDFLLLRCNLYELYNALFRINNKNQNELIQQKLIQIKGRKFYYQRIEDIEKNYSINIKDYYSEEKYNLILNIFNDEYLGSEDINEINDDVELNILGIYYSYKIKNNLLMKKYYERSIELGNVISMHNLASYYYINEKDFEKAREYYEMAVERNFISSIFGLSLYYINIKKNKGKMLELILYATSLDNFDLLNILNRHYNKLEIYNILINYSEKNKIINEAIKYLKKFNIVKIYENKITLFTRLNNVKECNICYENELHINLECGHDVCKNCYCIITKCPYRCLNNIA